MHQRKKLNLFIVWLSALLGLNLLVNLLPQAYAPLNGANFYEEITGLPFHPRTVDVNSQGHIFILSYDQDVWRSTDNGISWTKVFDDKTNWTGVAPYITRNFLTLFVDSKNYVFTNIAEGAVWNLYRSTDGGNTWSIVLGGTRRSWHMDEASNGTLWFHTYTGPGWAGIYKSLDQGATWSLFYNFDFVSEDLRTVAVNDFNDNEIWMATSSRVMYWNGSAWVTMHYNSRSQSYVSSIWFDSKYVYLGSEFEAPKRANWRYPHAPIPIPSADYDYYWDPDKLGGPSDEHSFRGLRINDIMLFGSRSQLWGSWDGNRWVKIVDLGDPVASDIEGISQRRPIYIVDKKIGKLYRLNITKEDLIQLYYAEFLKHRGYRINQENYIAEYRIVNGTNEVDLTNVALNNVQASIKGLSRKNYLNNSGFETGTTDGWTFSGPGPHSVSSTDRYEGTYSLKITKKTSDVGHKWFWPSNILMSRGEILTVSAWIKANVTLTDMFRVKVINQTGGIILKEITFNVTTSWKRIKLYYALNNPSVNVLVQFLALNYADYELFVDAFLFEKKEVEILINEPATHIESVEHLQYQPSAYFADALGTLNPSVTIARQSVSYSGLLTNGTESPATSLTGILTGAVNVDANIDGSGQAILRITGTRLLYEDSIILKGRASDVYYGRYYGTVSLNTTTNDLIALTSLQANITSLLFDGYKLILTIASPSGTLSITKVYCGDKGEPREVDGATSWSYDELSKILTTTATHSDSSITLTLKWKYPGDVNGDDVVNALDLARLGEAYGATSTGSNWDKDADLNGDNVIDAVDLSVVGKNYGKAY